MGKGKELSWTWDVYIRCVGAPFAKDTSNDGCCGEIEHVIVVMAKPLVLRTEHTLSE
jgi:hypothetical protein